MKLKPSEGIYYIVRYPKSWQLLTYRFAEKEEIDHSEWWDRDVVRLLTIQWTEKLGLNQSQLGEEIKLLTYGFPRGRITKTGRTYNILNGEDFTPLTIGLKPLIIEAFGIKQQCAWMFDDHEQCQELDRDDVRRILGIRDIWDAV